MKRFAAAPEDSRRIFVRVRALPRLAALALLLLFCVAAHTGHADQQGAGSGQKDASDASFFDLCRKGSPQQIAEAIHNGADLNARDVWGRTPLMEAAEKCDLAVMTALLEAGADVHARDKEGMTPLMLAVRDRFPAVTAGLVEAGAHVNAENAEKYTSRMKQDSKYLVLKLAARWNRLPETIHALVKAGANVNARDNTRMTPLLLALRGYPKPEAITALVKAGADVNAADRKGNTPLMFAAQGMASRARSRISFWTPGQIQKRKTSPAKGQ